MNIFDLNLLDFRKLSHSSEMQNDALMRKPKCNCTELYELNRHFCIVEWAHGERLSDGEMGWFPWTYVNEIEGEQKTARELRQNYHQDKNKT